jgi:transcriptional regulator with AAA-type ATPase domain/polyferredoxin
MSDQLPEKNRLLDDFYNQLEEMVVEQARHLINHNLYTKSILSTLPTALVATDRVGRIRSANQAAEEILGLGSLAKGITLASCFPKDQLLQDKIIRCLESGEGFTVASYSLLTSAENQSIVNIYMQPLRNDEAELCGLLIALEDQTYISFLQDSVQRYGSPLQHSSVVAESREMKQLMNHVAELSKLDEAVLLVGEPGCGKTFIARKLHEAAGHSTSAPYFVIDCKKLTDKDPRDFLFGAGTPTEANQTQIHFRSVHDYGAIHLAEGGTLVLQHVEALPLDAQQAFLDYLKRDQTGFLTDINAQIMATSCTDLSQRAEMGDFNGQLADLLFQRKLCMPTLRQRRKDILTLAKLFLKESEHGAQGHFSMAAENILISRHYDHNNASELKEAVSLAALVSGDAEILPEHIFTGPKEEENPFEFEISRIPFVNWALQDRVLGPLRYLVLVFFLSIAFSAILFSDSAIGQLANGLVWGIWWPAMVVVFLLLGRLWCTVCPLSKVAYLAKKLLNVSNPPPSWLKKHAFLLLPASFLLIIWIEQIFHMTVNPVATGLLLLSLMSLAAIFAMLFDRETWCRYLCPMGNLGAIYSLPATLNVRSNPSVCATLCTTHECHKGSETQLGCPVFHHPLYAREAHVCKLCFNCLKSCTHDSAKLHLRPPLIRIWRQGEISGSLSLFALTVFFISPVLLGTKTIDALAGSGGFSIATLVVIGVALFCQQVLLNRLVRDPEQAPLAMSRIALTLMVIGWGPLTAFQVANFPSVSSLVIDGDLGPVWGTLIPSGGLPLLKLVQTGILLFATLLAGITLWGVRHRLQEDHADVSNAVWLALLGLLVGYLAINMGLVLGA